MPDLIVGAGETLIIDQNFAVAPKYGLFRMETGSTIRVTIDLELKADKAEFAQNCLIDGRGSMGIRGSDGGYTDYNSFPKAGGNGSDGQPGHNVAISAGLAKPGGLTIVTVGGAGGAGGTGGNGKDAVFQGDMSGNGGPGGRGGAGGPAGQLTLNWVRCTSGLPTQSGAMPAGHQYLCNGGPGGTPGAGGPPGLAAFGYSGHNGDPGSPGQAGAASKPIINWKADIASLLWAQSQDIGPAPRRGHGLAFDPERGKLVLYGGHGESLLFGDTWEWDGNLWAQVADTGPAPRAFHGMTYDPSSRRVLVFGGAIEIPGGDRQSCASDTWGWDGQTWVQLADTGPSSRFASAMATDCRRNRVTLFGGEAPDSEFLGDTWEWDGTLWLQVEDTGPSKRSGSQMAFDADIDALLLFGGSGPDMFADTWSWNGGQWKQLADTGPSARHRHAMAPIGAAILLFGGEGSDAQGKPEQHDTWAWMTGSWRLIQDMGPAPRHSHAMAAFNGSEGETVTLFGGKGSSDFQDTWQLIERV